MKEKRRHEGRLIKSRTTIQKVFYFVLLGSIVLCLWTFPKDGNWAQNIKSRLYRSPASFFLPPMQNHSRIFFLETSGKGYVSLRHLIAVEASAKWNFDKEIQVYMTVNNASEPTQLMKVLSDEYSNIKYVYLKAEDFVRNSMLEKWWHDGKWKKSRFSTVHLSDALRLLMLWKDGGIYIDLDVVCVKDLNFPENAMMWESESFIATSCMAFQPHHEFIEATLKQFAESYEPEVYVANGPSLVTNEYQKLCSDGQEQCNVELLPTVTVTPVVWKDAFDLFREELSDQVLQTARDSVAVHWWNNVFTFKEFNPDSTCALVTVIKENAPKMYYEISKNGKW